VIDYSNEVFNAVATNLRLLYPGITVKGEYVATPAKFDCVTIDETKNVPTYLDNSDKIKYTAVQYRVQVFCNAENKRFRARAIFGSVDELLRSLGLVCKTYTTVPEIYNSEIYSITATYEGVIDMNGVIYRN
jgi:hypothetical protein